MPAPLAHGDAILTTAQQRLEAALGRLDTADRALLELSLRQGVEDVALADLLNLDPDDLASRRWRALERLAADLGRGPDAQLEADLVDLWSADEPEPLPFGDPVDPRPARSRRGSRAAGIVLVTTALTIAVGVVIGALAGGDDEDEPSRTARAPQTNTAERTRTIPPPPPRPVALEPLGGVSGPSGSARLERRQRLRLSVRGLPAGQYTAWLYTSIADALPIARFEGGNHTARVKLPEEAPRFRYVDVSREPPDGNPNHSGESVLRAPLGRVLGPA